MTANHPSHMSYAKPNNQVTFKSDSVKLGDAQKPAVTPVAFIQHMHDLLAEQKYVSARHWVERYPDVALDVLRSANASQAVNPALLAIAKVYDDQCCLVNDHSGWSALFKDRAEHPDRYAAHDAARQLFVEHMNNGRAKDALEVHLAAAAKFAPGAALSLDALQLTAEAQLHADKPNAAVATLIEAQKLAGSAFPNQSVRLLLLLSDAQRRAGQDANAVAAWNDAVELAATIVHSVPRVTVASTTNRLDEVSDPGMWERIAYMRPVSSPWPTAVARLNGEAGQQIELASGIQASPSTPEKRAAMEAQVWAAIGQWRLRRSEPQAALLAFKQGETFTTDQLSRVRLQVGEGQALAQLGQRVPAMALLNGLVANPDPEISQSACAVLGSLLFNDGQVAQAEALLRKAVAAGAKDWQGRAEAEADLGLACLAAGEEVEGLSRLHSAQQKFQAAGEFEMLQLCLSNEAVYLNHALKRDEAAALLRHCRELESVP